VTASFGPRDFLVAIWGHGPHSLCWLHPETGFRYTFCDSPDELLAQAVKLVGCDVWFGAHPLRGLPASGRGSRDDVAEVVAIPADLDWAHPTRRTEASLPTEAEVRGGLRRLGPDLLPSIVVNSGHGIQPWWLLATPVGLDEAEEMIAAIDAALEDVGLENGRSDLASILRLPGTFNQKREVE
jgi:hypothetical protein